MSSLSLPILTKLTISILIFALLTVASSCAIDNSTIHPSQVIGIHLGSSTGCVSIYENGRAITIPNDYSNRVTPMYVTITDSGFVVGEHAKNKAILNPTNTIYDIKRFLGQHYAAIDSLLKRTYPPPYTLADVHGEPFITISGRDETQLYSLEEIMAMYISKLRQTAEEYLGHEVTNAVISLPVDVTMSGRESIREAARLAGLQVLRVVNEAAMAAIAYGLDDSPGKEMNVLVYHLGGRTLDVTLLEIDYGIIDTIAHESNNSLGGDFFDQRMVSHYLKYFKKLTGLDASNDVSAVQRLVLEVERLKKELSRQKYARLDISSFYEGIDFVASVSRGLFEELNRDLFKATILDIEKVLADASISKHDIDEVILTGGSTRIPMILSLVKEFFDGSGKEPLHSISPDETAALGTGRQGGILSGAEKNHNSDTAIYCFDIVPLSFGVETVGGLMTTVLPRNCIIPVKKKRIFTTNEDNQDRMLIRVFEGERAIANDNRLCGEFELSGIPPAPRGSAHIELSFEMDIDGTLHVSATEQTTGKTYPETTFPGNGLSVEEQYQMLLEADKEQESDTKLREEIEQYYNWEWDDDAQRQVTAPMIAATKVEWANTHNQNYRQMICTVRSLIHAIKEWTIRIYSPSITAIDVIPITEIWLSFFILMVLSVGTLFALLR